MKVVVLGAGLMGVTTAYALWRDGHQVEVLERRESGASGVSDALSCLIAPSRALPWPTTSAHGMLWRGLTNPNASTRIIRPLEPRLWKWCGEFLSYASASEYARLSRAKLGFAAFSHTELQQVLKETRVQCGYQQTGALSLCRTEASLAAAETRVEWLAKHGIAAQLLSRNETLRLEPSLADAQFVGAYVAELDAQGDSREFIRALIPWLHARGVKFRFGVEVRATLSVVDRGYNIYANDELVEADKFVVALGARSYQFAKQLTLKLPLYPVTSFSCVVPLREPRCAPTRGGVCEETGLAYVPMGERYLRISVGAHFAGEDHAFTEHDVRAYQSSFDALFPGAVDWDDERTIQRWVCQRPMTPSSLPILTATVDRFGDGTLIWNCGQGFEAWLMACGSARIAADLVAEREPSFALSGMQRA